MTVEQYVHAGLHLEVIKTRLQRDRGIGAARMAPHHRTRIAHETTQIDHRAVVPAIELEPAHARPPGGDGVVHRALVQSRGPAQKVELHVRLHRACIHQCIVSIGALHRVQLQRCAKTRLVETDARAIELQIHDRLPARRTDAARVTLAHAAHPRQVAPGGRDEALDIILARRQIQRQHHRAKRTNVLDPGRLRDQAADVVVGDDQHRCLRCVAREDERVRTRFVRLVRDRIQAREVEKVQPGAHDDAVEAALLHREQQPIEVAKAWRQRGSGEGFWRCEGHGRGAP